MDGTEVRPYEEYVPQTSTVGPFVFKIKHPPLRKAENDFASQEYVDKIAYGKKFSPLPALLTLLLLGGIMWTLMK